MHDHESSRGTLPTNAERAIALAMSTNHIVGRTTLRRDDIHVWTSFMPTYDAYLTTVTAPSEVLAKLEADERWSDTREQAERTHEELVALTQAAMGGAQ